MNKPAYIMRDNSITVFVDGKPNTVDSSHANFAALRQAILDGATRYELQDLAQSKGMRPLEQSATRKVLAGVTTFEEMQRVLLSYPGA